MAVAQQEIEQARALAQQGKSEAAVALLSQLIQRDTSNVAAWLELSDVVDDPERAEYCLQKVLDLDPGNAAALEKLSETKGGSIAVGSVGGLNHSDSLPAADPELVAHTEASQAAESEEPQERVVQREAAAAMPEILAETSNADAVEPEGSQSSEARLEAAAATPQEPAQAPVGRSSVSRTDLILIGLTVLAGIVLCALVSAALIT